MSEAEIAKFKIEEAIHEKLVTNIGYEKTIEYLEELVAELKED